MHNLSFEGSLRLSAVRPSTPRSKDRAKPFEGGTEITDYLCVILVIQQKFGLKSPPVSRQSL
jgi:hypothetical protein